jgi:acyl carrier protein
MCGCGSQHSQQTVERVRSEVATILKKESAQIDIAKPLVAQGADELDIVEIVMAVEEALKVEIPDSAIGENVGEVNKTLTVEKLAEIVSSRQKTK